MSRLNYLVRDPISFAGFPWRTTANLVLGRVFTILYRCPHNVEVSTLSNSKKSPAKKISFTTLLCKHVSKTAFYKFQEKGNCPGMTLGCGINAGEAFCQGISDHFMCAKWDKFNNTGFDELTNKASTDINVSRELSSYRIFAMQAKLSW